LAANIKRLVLDSLKPRESSLLDLSKTLAEVNGIEEVDINVTEVDVKTETVKLTIRGTSIDYDGITKTLDEYGVTLRSIDEISVHKKRRKSSDH